MVKVEKFTQDRLFETINLSVEDDQRQFTVSDIRKAIERADEHEHLHLILRDNNVVGFFILDTQYAERYDFCPEQSLGIRGFLIDYRHQNQGIAQQALSQLPMYAATHYPEVQHLYLTVNCRNLPAYRCYVKSGFRDSGELYLGGAVGPQHIMSQTIAKRV